MFKSDWNQNFIIDLKINIFPLFRAFADQVKFFTKMPQNIVLDSFLKEINSEKRYKSYLKNGHQEYDILKYKVSNLSVLDIKNMYYKNLQKYTEPKFGGKNLSDESEQNSWMINELKIFVWIAVCYSFHVDRHLSRMDKNGWNFLVSVFYFKPLEILQFQLLSLLKGQTRFQSKKWAPAEIQLLKEILQDQSLNGKWNDISKIFFIRSGKKYFRKPQKCREQWFNHLNPEISHGPWTAQQDLELIEQVNLIGKKWSQISTLMGGKRTEHMVKNRYKSLLKKYELQGENIDGKQLTIELINKTSTLTSQQMNTQSMMESVMIDQQMPQTFKLQIEHQYPTNIETEEIYEPKVQNGNQIESQKKHFQQKMMEISQQKFFLKYKKSISLMSELDDDMQKYVESFLF